MISVKIDGTDLTNVILARVSLRRDLDSWGDYVGDPPPFHIRIERRCSVQEDRQIAMFLAAIKIPKKVSLTIKMQNSPNNDSVVFDMTNAFVANWELSNESRQVAFESIELFSGDCKMTAAGAGSTDYNIRAFIPE